MDALSVAVGAAAIVLVAHEVFQTLFRPRGGGFLTLRAFRFTWWMTGHLGPRARGAAGPLSMVVVIVSWVALTVAGWALVYEPWLPESFVLATSLDRASTDGFDDALYFAWITQSTLGYGDIAPQTPALRLLAGLQGTLGFGLFTMVVSWVLSVYPALQRQRAAATLAHALRLAHEEAQPPGGQVGAEAAARTMERLAEAISAVRVDLVQQPSTFYFAAPGPNYSLAAALPFISRLAREGAEDERTAAAAGELRATLRLLAETLSERYLGARGQDVEGVIDAYLSHHGLDAPARGV